MSKVQQTIIHNINIAKAGATCALEKHNLLALQVAFVLVILFLNLNNLNQDFRKKKKMMSTFVLATLQYFQYVRTKRPY